MTGNDTGATVYWRPGCPYCSRLLGDLDRIGLPIHKVNIWEDPAAAAQVRAVAGGNETVPTVVVGDTAMVNPRAAAVLDAVRAQAPDVLDGLDVEELAARAAGPWYAGLGVTLLAAVGWFVLAAANPTTSYHLAPAVVAAAWPVARRFRAGRPLSMVAAAFTALGGALIAVAVTVLLAARGALAGPILFGVPPQTEALLSVALGIVAGMALSLVGRRRKAGSASPDPGK